MTERKLLDYDELMSREPNREALQAVHALLSKDKQAAISRLEQLAAQGSVMSMLYLAHVFERGELKNPKLAEEWHRTAYQHGALPGAFGLGSYHYDAGNLAAAERYFREGIIHNDPRSMYWLATLFRRHFGDEKKAEVKNLLERSITLGHVRAKNSLSFLLMKGEYGLSSIPRGIFLYFSSLIDGFRVALKDPDSPLLW